MTVEEVTVLTPRPVVRSTLVQWWRELTFVHWAVRPERVAGLFPAGTRPDTHGGATYVGLIPFRMDEVGVLTGPGIPYLGRFCETNVRLYSVDDAGRRGVVFRSMDASRLLPALLGRAAVGLPYRWSSMRLRRNGDVITYTCLNRWSRSGRKTSRLVARAGAAIEEPTALERFLTARWGLHVSWKGRTWYLPNEHPSWVLHRAELLDLDDDLLAAAGVPVAEDPPVSVLYSPGVPVRFGTPSRVARR